MVRLPPSSDSVILYCDNVDACQGTFLGWNSREQTFTRARVRGWHIFDGKTESGTKVTWILCPTCVGRRGRSPSPPAVLAGQEELF